MNVPVKLHVNPYLVMYFVLNKVQYLVCKGFDLRVVIVKSSQNVQNREGSSAVEHTCCMLIIFECGIFTDLGTRRKLKVSLKLRIILRRSCISKPNIKAIK